MVENPKDRPEENCSSFATNSDEDDLRDTALSDAYVNLSNEKQYACRTWKVKSGHVRDLSLDQRTVFQKFRVVYISSRDSVM